MQCWAIVGLRPRRGRLEVEQPDLDAESLAEQHLRELRRTGFVPVQRREVGQHRPALAPRGGGRRGRAAPRTPSSPPAAGRGRPRRTAVTAAATTSGSSESLPSAVFGCMCTAWAPASWAATAAAANCSGVTGRFGCCIGGACTVDAGLDVDRRAVVMGPSSPLAVGAFRSSVSPWRGTSSSAATIRWGCGSSSSSAAPAARSRSSTPPPSWRDAGIADCGRADLRRRRRRAQPRNRPAGTATQRHRARRRPAGQQRAPGGRRHRQRPRRHPRRRRRGRAVGRRGLPVAHHALDHRRRHRIRRLRHRRASGRHAAGDLRRPGSGRRAAR